MKISICPVAFIILKKFWFQKSLGTKKIWVKTKLYILCTVFHGWILHYRVRQYFQVPKDQTFFPAIKMSWVFYLHYYRVTRKKVYLFLRYLYPNCKMMKLKEFYIGEFVLMNTAWICLRFVWKQSLEQDICIWAVFCGTAQM